MVELETRTRRARFPRSARGGAGGAGTSVHVYAPGKQGGLAGAARGWTSRSAHARRLGADGVRWWWWLRNRHTDKRGRRLQTTSMATNAEGKRKASNPNDGDGEENDETEHLYTKRQRPLSSAAAEVRTTPTCESTRKTLSPTPWTMTMTMTMTTTMPMTIPTPMTMTTTMTMLVQEAAGADQMDIEVCQETEVSRALRTTDMPALLVPPTATRHTPFVAAAAAAAAARPSPHLPHHYPTRNGSQALGNDVLSADRRAPSPCRARTGGGRASPTRFPTRSSMVWRASTTLCSTLIRS